MIKTNMKMWEVFVPKKMLGSKPKEYKVMGMEAYYRKYRKILWKCFNRC